MPKRVTPEQRTEILRMLACGEDRDTIAAAIGVTPGQVSAVSAHVKMGTYSLPDPAESKEDPTPPDEPLATTANLLQRLLDNEDSLPSQPQVMPILLGSNAESGEPVYWNPDPGTGSANPHVLVLGESGFGKTYTISCLIAELARQGILSIVFDYGQGFTNLPEGLTATTRPVELYASRDGIDINPLQIFPTDVLGPINVAQRVADTFERVYPRIGIQQHAVLRQAALDAMAEVGISPDDRDSWVRDLPAFINLQKKLEDYANNPLHPQGKSAGTASSHISTLFVFNTFRSSGLKISWPEMMESDHRLFIIQLKGLEHSLERAVTEFLLWNFIGYIESLGPTGLRCFVVLDEAHKLSFDRGSPVEKLLREGRKFGLGLILASQQPEDFSPVAFANTATKIVFQVGDERSTISRQLHRKIKNTRSFGDIFHLITKLPRGWAYIVTENFGQITKISSFEQRVERWHGHAG
jgi:DNA phosphorothioation-dependent restriction protein DptH